MCPTGDLVDAIKRRPTTVEVDGAYVHVAEGVLTRYPMAPCRQSHSTFTLAVYGDWPGGNQPIWETECLLRIIPLLNYLTSERSAPTMSSRHKTGKPDACGILADLWQLMQSVLDDAEIDMEAIGLSPKAFFLLAAIEEHPFPAEIARKMHLPPPTVTYLIKQLEEKGLVERRAEPGDLRKFRLVQTDAGRQARDQGQEVLGFVLGRRLERLDRQEIVMFDGIVKRLARRNGDGGKR